MVVRDTYKKEVFLKMLAVRLTGNDRVSQPHDTYSGRLFYLGGGYWRCIEDESGEGYHLINPDKTSDEIATVEAAMNIILH